MIQKLVERTQHHLIGDVISSVSTNVMNRLLSIGFEPSGHWLTVDGRLDYELSRHSTKKNILYAFICNAQVMYVGKTVRMLATRMSNYKTPRPTQTTNVNNNRLILDVLAKGVAVDILALPDSGLMHYGSFHMNLAAALEDDIIRKLDPPWNGGKVEKIESVDGGPLDPTVDTLPPFTQTFHFVLQPTYFRSGFFNVNVSNQKYLGSDGEIVELFLGRAQQPVLGTINRRANTNGTPRMMGGVALRDWFQKEAREMGRICVQVLSPTSIRLRVGAN